MVRVASLRDVYLEMFVPLRIDRDKIGSKIIIFSSVTVKSQCTCSFESYSNDT